MKKIIFSICLTTLLIFGCEKEPITPLEIADFSVAVAGATSPTAGNVAIDNYLTFLDISRNVISREWTISDGGSFISADFTGADTDFTPFIIPSAGKTSVEQKINVLFTTPGLQSVRIMNTFDKEPTDGPATAIQQGTSWVIDTTYLVDVFANIQPAFKVFKGEEEVLSIAANDLPDPNNSASWPVVAIEAGETLTYVDLTTVGRSNQRNWSFAGAVPATSRDSVATVSYFALGTYQGGGFTAVRGSDRPAQEAGKIIPITVQVNPSSEPFLFVGNLAESVDETISFNVGGELAPFSGQEGAFTINVSNEAAGFNADIPVASAKVSDADATKIELTLTAPIYNSDVVTVSYNGSEIKSADARTLSEFGPEVVTMKFADNVLPSDWAGFELPHANWKKGFCDGYWIGNGNGNATKTVFTRTEDFFNSGIASMKFSLPDGITEDKTLQGTNFRDFGLPAGSYLLSYKLYLDPENTMTTLNTVVNEPQTIISWDITNLARGEWVELSQIQTFDAAPTKRYDMKVVAAENASATGTQTFYIDDYSFIPLETRE